LAIGNYRELLGVIGTRFLPIFPDNSQSGKIGSDQECRISVSGIAIILQIFSQMPDSWFFVECPWFSSIVSYLFHNKFGYRKILFSSKSASPVSCLHYRIAMTHCIGNNWHLWKILIPLLHLWDSLVAKEKHLTLWHYDLMCVTSLLSFAIMYLPWEWWLKSVVNLRRLKKWLAHVCYAHQWGMLCPADTAEGEVSGLVKNLLLLANITTNEKQRSLNICARTLGSKISCHLMGNRINSIDLYLVFLVRFLHSYVTASLSWIYVPFIEQSFVYLNAGQ
jgi:hypothetical protein